MLGCPVVLLIVVDGETFRRWQYLNRKTVYM
jgi:hypothetical protein